jgi:hypothetical protein
MENSVIQYNGDQPLAILRREAPPPVEPPATEIVTNSITDNIMIDLMGTTDAEFAQIREILIRSRRDREEAARNESWADRLASLNRIRTRQGQPVMTTEEEEESRERYNTQQAERREAAQRQTEAGSTQSLMRLGLLY